MSAVWLAVGIVVAVLLVAFFALLLWYLMRIRNRQFRIGRDQENGRLCEEKLPGRLKRSFDVEIINGRCVARNGDRQLSERCDAAFRELSNFQKEFLLTVPPGQPNRLVFTEELIKLRDGTVETKVSFNPAK
ncbi:hypothetical protein PoB_000876500 [Plakobranchus ocellatus]|uniref:Uncharacterized protein n=1 Tax=Plakobranchus ocellatus TaxID=259542 RepID=A0AAV3YHQ0_9GAST|nr:hypothetical protein PoB_000876500 [Plakobranchus ocellatus]